MGEDCWFCLELFGKGFAEEGVFEVELRKKRDILEQN